VNESKATFSFATANLVEYRELHKKASPAHALGFKEHDCEACALLNEIERLRGERKGMVLISEAEFNRLRIAAGENPL
jgi:hypothetical protein